jgi:hypothetical protein
MLSSLEVLGLDAHRYDREPRTTFAGEMRRRMLGAAVIHDRRYGFGCAAGITFRREASRTTEVTSLGAD